MISLCNLKKTANLKIFFIFLKYFKVINSNYDSLWRTRKHCSNFNKH
ncbi:hypothetical protein D083_0573 [Dickeya solani RNS 08.23.3.1.A]|nr:hypothetical protein D083_0573 [Dickeya solani RNS 08.23.3.1.A]